jgi:predicted aconitase with swiveling domain
VRGCGLDREVERIAMKIRGKTVNGGVAEGEAIVTKMPFNFILDLDIESGKVNAGHELKGQELTGKIFVFPTGRGSTWGALMAYESLLRGTFCKGMVCTEAEPVIGAVAIMLDVPMVHRLAVNPVEEISTGDYIRLDATEGVIEVVKKRSGK